VTCDRARELLSGYLDGELDPAERQELERHLAECPGCSEELKALRKTVDLVRALPRVGMPAAAADKVRDRLRNELRGRNVLRKLSGWWAGARLASRAAVAVVVVLLVAVGFGTVYSLIAQPKMEVAGEPAGIEEMRLRQTGAEPAGKGDEAVPQQASPSASVFPDARRRPVTGYSTLFEQKIIKTAELELEVDPARIDEAQRQVVALVEGAGGFVQDFSTWTGEDRKEISVVLRVPAERFGDLLARLEELGTTKFKRVSGQDVTGEYVDVEARLRALRQQEERLLQILTMVKTVDEVLKVEMELGRIRQEIEMWTGRLRMLDNLVELSTIRLKLIAALPGPLTEGSDLLRRLWQAFLATVRYLGRLGVRLLVFLAGALPVIILVVAAWGGYRYWRRR